MSFDLNRALEDLAEAGAARRSADDDVLSARVGNMAFRIRRRRAARYAGTTVVAACAVGALAVGVAYLPGILGNGSFAPATSPTVTEPSAPPTDVTLEPLDLAVVCGMAISDLEDQRQLWVYADDRDDDPPTTDDAGATEVLGVTHDVNSAAVELEYHHPQGAQLLELGWVVLVVDADGIVVGALETGIDPAVSPPGVTGTGTTTMVPTSACSDDSPLIGSFDVIGIAEAHGIREDSAYVERAPSDPVPITLGVDELSSGDAPAVDDPFADVFACGQPAPESIHTLPDAGGLTLAVDMPDGPWNSLDEITGTIGSTDGQTIIANVTDGVSFALADESGKIVAFAIASTTEGATLVEAGPDSAATVSATTYLLGCGADGVLSGAGAEEGLEGTFTAWPYVTGVLKEVTDAEGNAETPSADPVLVIANPQEVEVAFLP